MIAGLMRRFRRRKISFVVGKPNLARDETTRAVRAAIHDEFHNGEVGLPLQCSEYVDFRVLEKLGIDIRWPVGQQRNGGRWAKIFTDAGLYRVSDEPSVHAAMCFTRGVSKDPSVEALGHVAFVEHVKKDGTISISETNWPRDGTYNERELSPAQWREQYGAQFIRFDT